MTIEEIIITSLYVLCAISIAAFFWLYNEYKNLLNKYKEQTETFKGIIKVYQKHLREQKKAVNYSKIHLN